MEYVGTAYAGFQRQPGKVTVQATLENALSRVTQDNVSLIASGRTDAGAHACNQVVAFTTSSSLPAESICLAANAYLPDDVVVTSAVETRPDFDPRADAHSRVYRYVIWNRPIRSPFVRGRTAHVRQRLDAASMHEAAQYLIGMIDVSAFVPVRLQASRTRHIYDAGCWREGHYVFIQLEASGFMRQMVRAIVGTLIPVGTGKRSIDDFRTVLASQDRLLAGETAPAAGLYLLGVRYAGNDVAGNRVMQEDVPWPDNRLSHTYKEEI